MHVRLGILLVSLHTHGFSQLLSTEIALSDWGLKDLRDIRFGQVAVIHETKGDRLSVYTLRNTLPNPGPSSFESLIPRVSENCLLVSNFISGMRNSLGGSFNVFYRAPSSASAEYITGSDGRRVLRLSFTKERNAFCGLWIHLFNSTAAPEERRYLDASQLSILTFWIRGSTGKEQLILNIADATWERKEDAVEIGDVGSFLPSGKIDTTWQQAAIPLSRFPVRIRKDQLATLAFQIVGIHEGLVDLTSIAFCPASSPSPALPPVESQQTPGRKMQRALWVWNTEELTSQPSKKKTLLDFLTHEQVTDVFLAIPYHASTLTARSGITIDASMMRPLVAEFKKNGIQVHALLGDKDFILPDRRWFVRTTLENILKYNDSSKAQERFYGIHFDVEPYLLPGFNGPRGIWILEQFLALLDEAATVANRGNLVMGADIPFWLDTVDEFSREKRDVNFRGVSKPVHEHVIDIVDLTVVMSYRTFAGGADGVVLHSSDEIEYGSRVGKKIIVGLETSPLPDENILTFDVSSSSQKPKLDTYIVLVSRGDSGDVHLIPQSNLPAFQNQLKMLGVDSTRVFSCQISRNVFVPGTKVSFSTLPASNLRYAIGQATEGLSSHPGFAGIAIHHSESHMQLLRRP